MTVGETWISAVEEAFAKLNLNLDDKQDVRRFLTFVTNLWDPPPPPQRKRRRKRDSHPSPRKTAVVVTLVPREPVP